MTPFFFLFFGLVVGRAIELELDHTQEHVTKLELGRLFFFFFGFFKLLPWESELQLGFSQKKSLNSSSTAQECVVELELGLLGHEELGFFTAINAKN
jgi:hypothetical protein